MLNVMSVLCAVSHLLRSLIYGPISVYIELCLYLSGTFTFILDPNITFRRNTASSLEEENKETNVIRLLCFNSKHCD